MFSSGKPVSHSEKIANSPMACLLMEQALNVFNQVITTRERSDKNMYGSNMLVTHSKIIKLILEGEFQEAADKITNWINTYTPHSNQSKD